MEVLARLRYSRMSAKKVRLVADQVRGKSVQHALDLVQFSLKRAAKLIKKTLESAIANAEFNNNLNVDELRVSKIYVDEGPTLKRTQARAKGRGNQILKRSCHITVFVSDSVAKVEN